MAEHPPPGPGRDRRGARRLHGAGDGDRSRPAQLRYPPRLAGRGGEGSGQAQAGSGGEGQGKAYRPAPGALRHHRRRGCPRLRRRGVRRGQARRRLAPVRGDRRCLALREGRFGAGRRGGQARQLGVFPRAGDPDAAGGAVQWSLLAESAGRPAGHGLRDDPVQGWQADRLPVLRSGDPLPCPPDLHQGQPVARAPRQRRGREPAPAVARRGAAPAAAVCVV